MQTQSSKAESPLSPQQAKGLAMRVSLVSVAVNLVLSAGKLLAGVFAHSGAMISDAVHSASDVFSTLIVMIGIQISSKQADAQHRYGHERFECVASVALALILLETGLLIGWKGLKTILAGSYADLAVPGSAGSGGSGSFHRRQGVDVLVYPGRGQEDSLRRPHGGRLASPV